MLKRLTTFKLTILAIALMSLPVLEAQTIAIAGRWKGNSSTPMPISAYKDDPFVKDPIVERMAPSRFVEDVTGRLRFRSDQVDILDEAYIYREDKTTGEFKPFAWNPWPETRSNLDGDFRFQNEERFPLFKPERGPDGKIILKDGLQLWMPNDLNLGMTTTFEAAYAVKDAVEPWSGRDVAWGNDGRLQINAHSFIDFNAFYAPTARQLFFGVVPYRLPGEPTSAPVKMFETTTSWEMVAHECGHAIHHALKPNSDVSDSGWRTWSESFADQTAMWASLRNRNRTSGLLAETNGDFNQSNSLTRMAEAFAAIVGEGAAMRDAFHDKKVSDTTEEIHDRSEVFTGAAYKLFLTVYSGLKSERRRDEQEALSDADQIMGEFLTLATDYTPENTVTLEDVAKAYLKIDREFFGGRYHNMLVDEFIRREIFDAGSLNEWIAHEAATPYLRLPRLMRRRLDSYLEDLLQANLDKLGIGPEFGLKLQSVTRDERYGQTIVRVQLTMGRGDGATPLDNHGILVFRRNGTLADYHAPIPPNESSQEQAQVQRIQAEQIRPLIIQAQQLRLDQRDIPLSIVRRPNGQLTVEARVMRGEGMNAYMEVFTLDKPQGERREIVIPPLPPNKRIPILDEILK